MSRHQENHKNYAPPNRSTFGLTFQLRAQQVQLQSLAQNLFKTQEEERQRFVSELHDELGQWLTAVYAEAEVISNSKIDSKTREGAQSIKASVDKMHDVIHTLMSELSLTLLDTLGLKDSLYDLKEKWCSYNTKTSFKLVMNEEPSNIDKMTNITIYRVVQEALNNISSHAKATQVVVHLNQVLDEISDKNILLLDIQDNGKGFDLEQKFDGFGLLGMRERVKAVGGEFGIYSEPGHGTQINVKLPI